MRRTGSREPSVLGRSRRILTVAASFLMVASIIPQQPIAALGQTSVDDLLVAAAAPAATPAETVLTDSQATAALAGAITDWAGAAPDVDTTGITVMVADLSGLELGRSVGNVIEIDSNAAGWGWTVSYPGETGRMDLSTVLRHEVGHILGLDHTTTGLMSEVLDSGQTRDVTQADADRLSSAGTGTGTVTTTTATEEPAAEVAASEDPVASLSVSVGSESVSVGDVVPVSVVVTVDDGSVVSPV
ncbi:MAG: matrixin family metalloprotease, partial [Actinomycetota bacterium]|nr:matrixin family metalloprotease [Actinomycetota bacterium]